MDETIHQEEFLEHYGIKGQKWGVRRYQNPDGTYTQLGLEREREKYESTGTDALKARKKADRSASKAEKAIARVQKKLDKGITPSEKAQEKAAKAIEKATKKNEIAEEKERIASEANENYKKALITSGSTDDILNYKGKMSQEEIRQAMSRIDTDVKMKELAAKDYSDGWYAADAVFNRVAKVSGYVKTASDAYNNVTGLYDKVKGRHKKDDSDIEAIIKSGDAQKILDNASKMSSSQIKDASLRITNLANIQKNVKQPTQQAPKSISSEQTATNTNPPAQNKPKKNNTGTPKKTSKTTSFTVKTAGSPTVRVSVSGAEKEEGARVIKDLLNNQFGDIAVDALTDKK